MNFEDIQKSWQSQSAPTVTISTDMLLNEVRRNQRHFRATIFWRDVREVGVAALLALLFFHWGLRGRDWTMYLLALSCLGVGTFMLLDRWWQRKTRPTTKDSLKSCLETSLGQVKHQIWLLKNVFWWYLLPFAVAVEISLGCSVWRDAGRNLPVAIGETIFGLLVIVLYWGIYQLNQSAVQKCLEPRRQELESLLFTLDQ
jgi:hypothetical protein